MAQCNFSVCTGHTIASSSSSLPMQKKVKNIYYYALYCRFPSIARIGRNALSQRTRTASQTVKMNTDADSILRPGDWAEVKSYDEIKANLDGKNRLYGLNFMPEMRKYCEKQFRVFKQVNKIMLESTGDLRTLKRPTYYLEGVYCDGEFHEGCDRSCFLLWREEWIRKVAGP